MEFLMLLALPLMMLGGFGLDVATSGDEDAREDEPADTDAEPIL